MNDDLQRLIGLSHNNNTMVIPAILEHTSTALTEKINLARVLSPWVHIDLIDSSFSQQPNDFVLTPQFFKQYTHHVSFELHMMVREPASFIKSYAECGFKRFIGHVEHMSHKEKFIEKVRHNHAEPFLGIDLDTPLEKVFDFPVHHSGLSGVTILCVNAGKSGQEFSHDALEKITQIRRHHPDIAIEVDGGINDRTLPMCKKAGATIFASTSDIFKAADPVSQYQTLSELASRV